MHKIFLKLLLFIITGQLLSGNALAEEKGSLKFDLNRIVLPSEVETLGKSTGAIYYNRSIKGKVLVPIHFWGEFSKSGLHFIPINSTLISGISMAGGPRTTGLLDEVKLTRRTEGNKISEFKFDLTKGGDLKTHNFILQEGDTIFIEKSMSESDRSFYLSLISTTITVLTTFLVIQKIDDNKVFKVRF